jgi:flagellin
MGMVINTNLSALNTYNQLNKNNGLMNSSLEKLSSGYRINSAADDAAGLAISEKMRGQIRGLDQASANAQDAISLVQTAEGALDESTSILQRMRELAVQASTDTLTDDDRTAVQDEMTQLTSELNRIGNTTEFNTKNLLKGDGQTNLTATGLVNTGTATTGGSVTTVEATQTIDNLTIATAATGQSSITATVNGEALTVNFVYDASLTDAATVDSSTATENSITIKYNASTADLDVGATVASALTDVIAKNSSLADNWIMTSTTDSATITAATGSSAAGAKGYLADLSVDDTGALFATDPTVTSTANIGTTTEVKSTVSIDLSAIASAADAQTLLGKGLTINGTQIEFYDADAGAYTGDAVGINISSLVDTGATVSGAALADAIVEQTAGKLDGVTLATNTATNSLTVTATATGAEGNGIAVKDGGVQEAFEATFQIGANTGQTMSLSINDMRSQALLVSSTTASGTVTVKDNDGNDVTATYKAVSEVTDGTSDTNTEYALDVSTADNATAAISVIDAATSAVSSERSKLGAVQNRLEHTINNLTTSSENLTSAESRIRDVDMASEMAEYTKLSTLNQAATAMLAQANQLPQQVLTLLQ